MFGIGFTELLIIGVVLLVAVGPTRLPKLLKSVVGGYRELRRATRDLRASTGIDEILQDEDLRELRRPLHVPMGKPGAKGGSPKGALPHDKAQAKGKKFALSFAEREQEVPAEGVDVAEIRDLENRPSAEEAERIRAAKEASLSGGDVRAAKIAAAKGVVDEQAQRVIAAKEAAAISAKEASAAPPEPAAAPADED